MIHATILIKNFRSIFFSVNLDVDVTYLLDQYEFRMYVEVMVFVMYLLFGAFQQVNYILTLAI